MWKGQSSARARKQLNYPRATIDTELNAARCAVDPTSPLAICGLAALHEQERTFAQVRPEQPKTIPLRGGCTRVASKNHILRRTGTLSAGTGRTHEYQQSKKLRVRVQRQAEAIARLLGQAARSPSPCAIFKQRCWRWDSCKPMQMGTHEAGSG